MTSRPVINLPDHMKCCREEGRKRVRQRETERSSYDTAATGNPKPASEHLGARAIMKWPVWNFNSLITLSALGREQNLKRRSCWCHLLFSRRDKGGACAERRFIPEHRRGLNYPAGYDDGADSSFQRLNMLLSVTCVTDSCKWVTSPDHQFEYTILLYGRSIIPS